MRSRPGDQSFVVNPTMPHKLGYGLSTKFNIFRLAKIPRLRCARAERRNRIERCLAIEKPSGLADDAAKNISHENLFSHRGDHHRRTSGQCFAEQGNERDWGSRYLAPSGVPACWR